jgi:hypothetical protein
MDGSRATAFEVKRAKAVIVTELRDSPEQAAALHGMHGSFRTPASGEPGYDVAELPSNMRPFCYRLDLGDRRCDRPHGRGGRRRQAR